MKYSAGDKIVPRRDKWGRCAWPPCNKSLKLVLNPWKHRDSHKLFCSSECHQKGLNVPTGKDWGFK